MGNNNNNQQYTWCLSKKTDEWHLFRTLTSTTDEKCKYEEKSSICKEMDSSQSLSSKDHCVNEDDARLDAALYLKRKACGTCVSSLYSDR